MNECLFATTGGVIQCAKHEVRQFDYDTHEEFEDALVPLCIRADCLNCKICNEGQPCRSKTVAVGKAKQEVVSGESPNEGDLSRSPKQADASQPERQGVSE